MPEKVVQFGFKTQLLPTNKARRYFVRASGTQRFAYNLAWERGNQLDEAYARVCEEAKAAGLQPRSRVKEEMFFEAEFRKEINKQKRELYPWMLEVTKCAVQQGIKDYARARANHFRNPKWFKRPRRKTRRDGLAFYIDNHQCKVVGNRIWVPLLGHVKLCETLPDHTKLLNVVISEKAGKWYAAFVLEGVKRLPRPKQKRVIGVDLNVKDIVCSTGERYSYPDNLKVEYRRMQRLQRQFSRKKKGSIRRRRLGILLSKAHKRIADIRRNFLHVVTTRLVQEYEVIAIEDLNVCGMGRNRKLARVIYGSAFSEFRRMLQYKADWRGNQVWAADRFYPSSKTCSYCGFVNKALLRDMREWTCPSCGRVHDRDVNAALNLREKASSALRGAV